MMMLYLKAFREYSRRLQQQMTTIWIFSETFLYCYTKEKNAGKTERVSLKRPYTHVALRAISVSALGTRLHPELIRNIYRFFVDWAENVGRQWKYSSSNKLFDCVLEVVKCLLLSCMAEGDTTTMESCFFHIKYSRKFRVRKVLHCVYRIYI